MIKICKTCVYWVKCSTQVEGYNPENPEKICGFSRNAAYGLHGQDGRPIITPENFGCINWKVKNE